ncbi:MAG: tRNA (adenosine(37)-N6)-dimethylallyltransferase MiaA, partial [Acidobacteriota bacterium]
HGWQVEPMKGIGYREFEPYFEGKQSLSVTKRKIVRSTLELAKRQRTWFKRHPEITWVEEPKQALGLAEKFLSSV